MSTTILTRTAPAPAKPRSRAPRKAVDAPTRRSRRQLRADRRATRRADRRVSRAMAPDARALDLHVRSTSLWPRTYR